MTEKNIHRRDTVSIKEIQEWVGPSTAAAIDELNHKLLDGDKNGQNWWLTQLLIRQIYQLAYGHGYFKGESDQYSRSISWESRHNKGESDQ